MQNLEAQANADLLKAQKAIRETGLRAEGRGQFGNYIRLNELLDVIVPPLNENGFFFTQGTEIRADSKTYMVTRVRHINGITIELNSMQIGFAAMPKDVQKLGAEETYLRKYGISCAFGLYGENDDDGQSLADDAKDAGSESDEKLSKDQANHIKILLKDNPDLMEKILKSSNKMRVGDFEKSRYPGLLRYIETELKKGVA